MVKSSNSKKIVSEQTQESARKLDEYFAKREDTVAVSDVSEDSEVYSDDEMDSSTPPAPPSSPANLLRSSFTVFYSIFRRGEILFHFFFRATEKKGQRPEQEHTKTTDCKIWCVPLFCRHFCAMCFRIRMLQIRRPSAKPSTRIRNRPNREKRPVGWIRANGNNLWSRKSKTRRRRDRSRNCLFQRDIFSWVRDTPTALKPEKIRK